MSNVIDTLFLELGIDTSRFSGEARDALDTLERMTDSFERAEAQADRNSRGLDRQSRSGANASRQAKNLTEALGRVAKGFAALGTLILGSNAFNKLTMEIAQANTELDNLSRNLGMSRQALAQWGGMAAMAGGSADGMRSSLQNLSMGITRLTTMGDTGAVPFFNAFGVALLNADGKARDLDSIMLDLADRFGTMDRVQAYNLAKSMGLDDGTINTLLLGRAEMERMLALQQRLYRSGDKEVRLARELTQARGYLNQQWGALRTMLADALAPVLLKVVKIVSGWMDFLMRHEKTAKNVFEGAAIAIALVLLPVLLEAVAALYAFIAPFALAIAAVVALGAAFILLYDDYKTWAEGGKSLFDWGGFVKWIKGANFSVDNLGKAFVYLLTGYTDLASAFNAAIDWLRLKGFIDENGMSLRSLATGFKNLAKDIINIVAPAFQDLGEVFGALWNRDFDRATEAAKRLVIRPVNFIAGAQQAGLDRAAGALDHAAGYTPGAPGTASHAVAGKAPAAMAAEMIKSTARVSVQASQETARAAQYAMEKALPKSAAECAKYVNNALRAQGIQSYGHGKDVAGNLLRSKQGFHQVKYDSSYVPQDGDIMSIDHGRHSYGHVAIYNAKLGKWISDYVQHNTFGNTAATNAGDYKKIMADPSRVTIVRKGGGAPQTARASTLAAGGNMNNQKHMGRMVYQAFRNAGLSDAQARVMAAEVGRENGWRADTVFGYHKDPHKGVNVGMLSWQGQRGREWEKLMQREGHIVNGQIVRSQAALDAQARFAVAEMRNNSHGGSRAGNEAIRRFLSDPNIDAQTGMDIVGKDFIRWRINDPKFRAAGLRNRNQYLHMLGNTAEPIVGHAVAAGARQAQGFVRQGEDLRHQNITHNNQRHVEVAINGGIHVQSSANSIDGTLADAASAARDHMFQLTTGLV